MSGKRIAVITARADAGEQKEILLGISGAAMSAGADTVVFSNIYNHWVRDDMLNFENIIYALFDPGLFDGVIITAEAFMDISVLEDVIKSVRDSGITAVVIDGEIDGFMSVSSDDAGDMEQIAEHLISVHHFTDIDILAGKKDDPTSQHRINGCVRAFERHGTTIDPNKIHHGNYWTDSGEELAERYINGELPFPEAVICANDHMAYGLCDRLIEAGVDIPGRITVTGYDHTGGRLLHYPFLTTFRRSRREMGRRAVELCPQSRRREPFHLRKYLPVRRGRLSACCRNNGYAYRAVPHDGRKRSAVCKPPYAVPHAFRVCFGALQIFVSYSLFQQL